MERLCNSTVDVREDKIWSSSFICSIVVLVIAVPANLVFWRCLRSSGGQPLSIVLRTMSASAIFCCLWNGGGQLVTAVNKGWFLNYLPCQVYGSTLMVLIAAWSWMVALTSFERFVFMLRNDEQSLLFSTINTRIFLLAVWLTAVFVYVTPVYGWAEYSVFRGQLEIQVKTSNASVKSTNQCRFAALQRLRELLCPAGLIHCRAARHKTLSLRFIDSRVFGCFESSLKSGQLSDMMNTDASNMTCENLEISINNEDYNNYHHVIIPMQDSVTCGLDMTSVNANLSSFLCYSTVLTVLFPLLILAYFNLRLLVRTQLTTAVINMTTSSMQTTLTRLVFVTSLVESMTMPSYWISNILAVRFYMPPPLFLTLANLPLLRFLILPLTYFILLRLPQDGARHIRIKAGDKMSIEHTLLEKTTNNDSEDDTVKATFSLA